VSLVTIKRLCHALAIAVALTATLSAAACTTSAHHGSARPSTATTSAPPRARAQPFPAQENQRPGTSAWRITDLGAPGTIGGYADQRSVLPGQSFRLYVSTTAGSFRVMAFRFGWCQGHQARLVWTSQQAPGQRQTAEDTAPAPTW
jgi:hypothetical protein